MAFWFEKTSTAPRVSGFNTTLTTATVLLNISLEYRTENCTRKFNTIRPLVFTLMPDISSCTQINLVSLTHLTLFLLCGANFFC